MLTIPKEFLDAFREECRQASDEQLAASLSQFALAMSASMFIGLMKPQDRTDFFAFLRAEFEKVDKLSASEYKKRGYSDSRILPVTRKKRDASSADYLDQLARRRASLAEREAARKKRAAVEPEGNLYSKENLIAELKAEMKR